MTILEVGHLKKVYVTRFGAAKVQALSDVNFSVEEGEFVAVMGESGSGKTTLLNILAGLDKPTSGTVKLKGHDMTRIPDNQMAAYRRENLGFVFQDFNLLDTFSLLDNIYLPMVLSKKSLAQMEEALRPLAETLGLTPLLDKYPYEVSGGQKQRAAVARALITGPKLLLADEPTGALDSRAADSLMQLFETINQNKQTIVMVTHSTRAASHAGRVIFIKDGIAYHQLYRGNCSQEEMFQKISDTLKVMEGGKTKNDR